jgi:hypothetical protein
VIGDSAAYANAMASELAGYPADVLNEAVRRARRTLEWLPAIAQMTRICDHIIAERQYQLSIAERMLEETEAQQARRRGLEDKAARMRAAYGDAAVSADELDLALSFRHSSFGRGRFATLPESLESGEHWAAVLIRRLALAESARRAEKAGHINAESAAAIAELVMVDEPAARQQLADQIGEDYPFRSLVAVSIGKDDLPQYFDAVVEQIADAALSDRGIRR